MKVSDAIKTVQPVLDRRGPVAKPVPDNVVRIILLTRVITDLLKHAAHDVDCRDPGADDCPCGVKRKVKRAKEAIR